MKRIERTFILISIVYWLIAIAYCFICIKDKIQCGVFDFEILKDLPIVTIVSAYVTLYVSYIYQTSSQRMQENSIKISGKSDINFKRKQEFISQGQKTLFKMRIYDHNKTMLKKAKINSIDISFRDSLWNKDIDSVNVFDKSNSSYFDLEYTPAESNMFEKDEDFYYACVLLSINKKRLIDNIFVIRVNMSVCSMYDVETSYRFSLIFNTNGIKTTEENWFRIEHYYVCFDSIKYNGL